MDLYLTAKNAKDERTQIAPFAVITSILAEQDNLQGNTMRNFAFAAFLFSIILASCSSSSNAKSQKATATLQIFHSNDINGYLKECG
jgi:hypothetical protein